MATQARSLETRRRLLDAAVEALIKEGYHACTTIEIVRRAGVARGAYIHHFGSQPELMRAALHHLADKRLQSLERSLKRVKGGDRIGQLIEMLFTRLYSGDLFEAMCELWVAARTTPYLRPIVWETGLEFRDRVISLLEAELTVDGRPRDNLRERIECVIDPMIGAGLTSLLRGRRHLLKHTDVWRDLLVQFVTDEAAAAIVDDRGEGRRMRA